MIALVLVCTTAATATAGDWRDRFRLYAGIGYEYDDNVVAPEVDRSAERGASAGIFEAGIAVDAVEGDTIELELGYDYFESLYAERDVDELDLRLHLPWAIVTRHFERVDLEFEWRASFAELGDERYLATNALGPTVSRLVGRSVYLSGGYRYEYRAARRSHPLVTATNDRTAHRHTLRAGALWLPERAGIKLRGALLYRNEDATEDQNQIFDYQAFGLQAAVSWSLPLEGIGQGPPEFQARVGYDKRTYRGISRVRTGGGRRRDDRMQLSIGFELPLLPYLYGRMSYERFQSGSNDPAADYNSNAVRLQLEGRY